MDLGSDDILARASLHLALTRYLHLPKDARRKVKSIGADLDASTDIGPREVFHASSNTAHGYANSQVAAERNTTV